MTVIVHVPVEMNDDLWTRVRDVISSKTKEPHLLAAFRKLRETNNHPHRACDLFVLQRSNSGPDRFNTALNNAEVPIRLSLVAEFPEDGRQNRMLALVDWS